MSPDERGSNSSFRKITLSRCERRQCERRRGVGGGWSAAGGKKDRTGRKLERFLYFLQRELRRTYVKYDESTAFHERRLGKRPIGAIIEGATFSPSFYLLLGENSLARKFEITKIYVILRVHIVEN